VNNEIFRKADTPDTCPHCGHKLNPWQQVLLSVDRALMCKNCWYRILLDKREEPEHPKDISDQYTPRTKD
jgi:DNA-directed RNA polymerase subunit RPC12/RpoP